MRRNVEVSDDVCLLDEMVYLVAAVVFNEGTIGSVIKVSVISDNCVDIGDNDGAINTVDASHAT